MKILALGDSFTYGSELADIKQAWPYLLANKLSGTVVNQGKAGCSNEVVVDNLVSSDISQFDLVVILWTHFDRFEICDDVDQFTHWPGGRRKDHREAATYRPLIIDYWNYHHNDKYLYRQYLKTIVLTQSYLVSHGKRFVMADAFGNHKDPGRYEKNNQDLIDQIDKSNFLGWPNESTLEWVGDVPVGPQQHYLDQGHQIVAERFYQHLTNQS